MGPTYLKLCEKVLQQKQQADKRNELLHKKINILEKKVIELEVLSVKYENLTRDHSYLELELRELKRSRDANFMSSLKQKSKIELSNQILELMSQVSVLEKTNTELWIDKRKLARELAALKPSPLSVICETKEPAHQDVLTVDENLSSILSNASNSNCNSADTSFVVDDALKLLQENEKKEPKPRVNDTCSPFHICAKRRFSSTLLSDGKTLLSTPPIAVIPRWCAASADESKMPRSMVVSTVFSDSLNQGLSSIDINKSFLTATSYRKIEVCRPKSMTVLSTTL